MMYVLILIYVDKSGRINSHLNSSYLFWVKLGEGEADYHVFKEMFYFLKHVLHL